MLESPVRGAKIEVATPDGVMDAYITHPVAKRDDETWPGVVLFMDGLGLRDAIFQMCDRLASYGFFVISPNMYWRKGAYAPFDPKTVFAGPGPEMDRITALVTSVDDAGAMRDATACFDLLAKTKRVRGAKYGTTGYCLGGGLSIFAACKLSDRVAAAASFHGGRFLVEPDAPAVIEAEVKCPVYIGVAEIDRRHTPETTKALEHALAKAKVPHRVELYAGTSHGWCVPDVPVFDAKGAEEHWTKLVAFFREHL